MTHLRTSTGANVKEKVSIPPVKQVRNASNAKRKTNSSSVIRQPPSKKARGPSSKEKHPKRRTLLAPLELLQDGENINEHSLPPFTLIDKNEISPSAQKLIQEDSVMVCSCKPDESGGCYDTSCVNRLLHIECGSRCPIKDNCQNKRFQKRLYAEYEPFLTDLKGWGLRATKLIKSGDFIIEYVGEVVDSKEMRRRQKKYTKKNHKHHYTMCLKNKALIDATFYGNYSRFVNHSCDPNAETQKWTVAKELRVGFFAKKDISPGEEIVFDYKFERFGKEAQPCYCGAANCNKYIGGKPDESDVEGIVTIPEDETHSSFVISDADFDEYVNEKEQTTSLSQWSPVMPHHQIPILQHDQLSHTSMNKAPVPLTFSELCVKDIAAVNFPDDPMPTPTHSEIAHEILHFASINFPDDEHHFVSSVSPTLLQNSSSSYLMLTSWSLPPPIGIIHKKLDIASINLPLEEFCFDTSVPPPPLPVNRCAVETSMLQHGQEISPADTYSLHSRQPSEEIKEDQTEANGKDEKPADTCSLESQRSSDEIKEDEAKGHGDIHFKEMEKTTLGEKDELKKNFKLLVWQHIHNYIKNKNTAAKNLDAKILTQIARKITHLTLNNEIKRGNEKFRVNDEVYSNARKFADNNFSSILSNYPAMHEPPAA